MCADYAARMGFDVVATYSDPRLERTARDQMLTNLDAVDVLVISEPDRLSRNLREMEHLADTAHQVQVHVARDDSQLEVGLLRQAATISHYLNELGR